MRAAGMGERAAEKRDGRNGKNPLDTPGEIWYNTHTGCRKHLRPTEAGILTIPLAEICKYQEGISLRRRRSAPAGEDTFFIFQESTT